MLRWLIGWVLLFALYLLLTGDVGGQELVAGALSAAVAIGAGILARRRGGRQAFRFRWRWLRRAAVPAGSLVVDLVRVGRVLAAALAGRRPAGVVIRQPFDSATDSPPDAARVALVVLGASFAPNGIALGVAPNALLLHRLAPGPPTPDRAWPL